MKKRILSLAMCLCMVLTLLPATALAADGGIISFGSSVELSLSETPVYWVNGGTAPTTVEPAAWNAKAVMVNGTATLYLKDAVLNDGSGIYYAAGALNLVVAGDNTVNGGSYGISVSNGALSITGSGKLTATATSSTAKQSYGIHSNGDLSISGSALEIVATGGNAIRNYGLYAQTGNISISDGATVTARGGDVSNDSVVTSYGVFVDSGSLAVTDSSLTGLGGAVSYASDAPNTYAHTSEGVYVSSSSQTAAVLTNSTVVAAGGSSPKISRGMHLYSTAGTDDTAGITSLTVDGGTLSASASGGTGSSYGIHMSVDYYPISQKIAITHGAFVTADTVQYSYPNKSALTVDAGASLLVKSATIENVGTITNNGTLYGAADAALTGTGTQVAYGGDVTSTALDVTAVTVKTAYTAGSGLALWTPTLGDDSTTVTGGTMALDGASIGGSLALPANTTLTLTGENTTGAVRVTETGDLAIQGTGSLKIETALTEDNVYGGISVNVGNVTVEGSTLDITVESTKDGASGIFASGDITLTKAAVNANVIGTDTTAFGIHSGGTLTIMGGTADVTACSSSISGGLLTTNGSISLTGCEIAAKAGSYGIYDAGSGIALGDGMKEVGGNVVSSGTLWEGTYFYTFAAADSTITIDNVTTDSAKSVFLTSNPCFMSVGLDEADYDTGDPVTATVLVKALTDTASINSVEFALSYDADQLEFVELTSKLDGWTMETLTDGTYRMVPVTTGDPVSVTADGLTVATATFKVKSDVTDNTNATITLTDPELKNVGDNNGFTPVVTPATAALHNIVVTLQPTAGATLTVGDNSYGAAPIDAYAKYGVAGLYSDAARMTEFTMPTVKATSGYRLAAGTEAEPLWNVSGGTTTYANNDAVLNATYPTSTTLTIQVVKTYTVTVTQTDGGTLSSYTSPMTVDTGTVLTPLLPTATENSNYSFEGWYFTVTNDEGTTAATKVTETTTITGDTTAEARFVAESYDWNTPTATNAAVAITDGVTDNKVTYNTPVTFTVTPDAGYVINTVTFTAGDGVAQTLTPASGTCTIPGDKITGNVTVTVTTAELCTITFANVTGATLSGTPTYYGKIDQTGLYSDEACTSRITDESVLPTIAYDSGDGWRYAAPSNSIWSYSGASSGTCTSSDLLGNRVNAWRTNYGDITVIPNVVKQYLITLKVDDENHATMYKKGSTTETASWAKADDYLVNMGEPTITYAPGYVFKSFTFGGTEYTTWSNGGYWMDSVKVTKADTLTLNTQPGTYAVTFPETITGATISDKTGITDGKATFGTKVTFKVTASEGYAVESVTYTVGSGDAVTIEPDAVSGIYTIPGTAITDAVSVTVSTTQLHKVQFVNTAATPHGSLGGTTTFYLADNATLTENQMKSVTVTPNTGYELKYWTVDDTETVPTNYAVTADTTFTAVFGLADYTMTVPDNMTATVGSATGQTGEITVHYGTNIVLMPNTNSQIVAVSYKIGSGEAQALTLENGSYTILGTAVTGNLTVTATTLAGKGFALSYISKDEYKALATDTMIVVLTPITDDANGAAVTGITMTDGTAFYWSESYGAFVKIVSTTATAETICGGLTFSTTGEKNAIAYTGDINGDGKISAADAAVANEILHNSARADTTELMRLKCDVTDNDTTGAKIVTSDDILWILKRPGVIA